MQREIIRTIQSFLAPYQQGIKNNQIEIIVIDTGSDSLPDLSQFIDKIKFVQYKSKHPSPVEAVNHGIEIASSNLVGVLIDGARMVTPGMCRDVINVNKMHDRVFISTLAFHLGPKVQMESVFEGYNQGVEDQLLDAIDWTHKGYDLYLASSLALSSINGLFGPIAESNAIFTTKEIWSELNGFDQRFISIGGGLSNLDVYKRACELKDLKHIRLSSEATFHQVHGGVATNNKQGKYDAIFHQEYESIHNKGYAVPNKIPELYGDLVPQAQYFFKKELQKQDQQLDIDYDEDHIQYIKTQIRLNRLLKNNSLKLKFDYANTLSSLLDSPIILTGRGGSGTRILSQLIQELGLFIGNKLNKTEDSEEWVKPIYSLIHERLFLANKTFNDKHIKQLRDNAIAILHQADITADFHWGFKLPETMLCLPELISAFPKAKVIHLTRHPVNLSLRRSHVTSRYEDKIGHYVLQQGYKLLDWNFDLVKEKPMHINNAISWHYQLAQVLDFVESQLDDKTYCEIKYEDVCKNPQKSFQIISDFLGINLEKVFTNKMVIDQSRVNKIDYHEKKQEVDAIWNICGVTAQKLNYTKVNYDICLKQKNIIFVLGMHRSGTSALTRVINIMGASVPDNLMESNTDNNSGYWESKRIVAINNQLLSLADTNWFDDSEISPNWQVSDVVKELKLKAIELIKTCFRNENPETMVLKDPRFSRLMPFWVSVMNELSIRYTYVIVFRHPSEVFGSFKTRYSNQTYRPASIIHPEKLNLLWLRHVLDAELLSRNNKRHFINYHDLVNYPVNTVLDLELFLNDFSEHFPNKYYVGKLTEFISKNQQHHKNDEIPNQSELNLSCHVYNLLKQYSNINHDTTQYDIDDVRIKFNRISSDYKPLTKQSKHHIHETSPWIKEIGQSVLRYLGNVNSGFKILFFSGEPSSKGHTYRVKYRMEALKKAGMFVEYQDLESPFSLEKLKDFSAIIMYRVTWSDTVKSAYDYCNTHRIFKIFDVDDLVFLPEIMTYDKWDYLRLQTQDVQNIWHKKFINYSITLINSDHVIVPTQSLAQSVKEINKPVSVIENGIGQEMLENSNKVLKSGYVKPSEKDGYIRIGYASGSPTHQKDFTEVYEVLNQLLNENDQLKLVIVGYLELNEFPLLQKHKNRIETRPLVDHMDLFSEYYRFDINIAPLQSNNIFCEGKSQLKYHESALVAVPTVASATQPYRDAIHVGVNGYVAKNTKEWFKYLSLLINDKTLRNHIGETANKHAIAKFGPKSQSMLSSSVMNFMFNSYHNENQQN